MVGKEIVEECKGGGNGSLSGREEKGGVSISVEVEEAGCGSGIVVVMVWLDGEKVVE